MADQIESLLLCEAAPERIFPAGGTSRELILNKLGSVPRIVVTHRR
ncbi:MAG: hypothetical protein OXC63_03475 [Aestuariivita sp.]|nr:hypothetical protein [Aestuariivita sp.]MCY4346420.1 hypothetical protein [Aestuariivita sp.]